MPKINDEPATLESLTALVKTLQIEIRDGFAAAAIRAEATLISRPKRAVTKKADGDKSADASTLRFSNTMYFWAHMYKINDPCIKGMFKKADEDAAEKACEKVKDMPEGVDKRRAIGMKMWSLFSKEKKTNDLKTLYDNWNTAGKESKSKTVVKDPSSDSEEKEAPKAKPKAKAKAKPTPRKKKEAPKVEVKDETEDDEAKDETEDDTE